MHPIDVHIVDSPKNPAHWKDECYASLENQPINIYIVPYVAGDTRAARRAGFKCGSAPYVSFVDPDDTVTPGAYAALLEHMSDQYCGVYSMSRVMSGKGVDCGALRLFNEWDPAEMKKDCTAVHQLNIMHRGLVQTAFDQQPYVMPPASFDWVMSQLTTLELTHKAV